MEDTSDHASRIFAAKSAGPVKEVLEWKSLGHYLMDKLTGATRNSVVIVSCFSSQISGLSRRKANLKLVVDNYRPITNLATNTLAYNYYKRYLA